MIKSKFWTYAIALLLVTGILTAVTEGINMQQAQKPIVEPLVESNQETKKVVPEKKVQKEPPAEATLIQTKVGGWGFLKNSKHQTPGITAEQEALVKKYGAMFVGDESKKEIALTFDLGYENGYTGRILDTLKTHQVKAIFFVTGPWLEGNPELAKRMVKEGHIVGNHTWSHPSLPTIPQDKMKDDITKLQDYIYQVTGQNKKLKYLRPPKGEYSEQSLLWTKEMGYTTVLWSIALKDWLPMSGPQEAIDGVTNNLHNGAIILLHGVSKDVTEGLDTILHNIKQQGYKVVPITKLSPRK